MSTKCESGEIRPPKRARRKSYSAVNKSYCAVIVGQCDKRPRQMSWQHGDNEPTDTTKVKNRVKGLCFPPETLAKDFLGVNLEDFGIFIVKRSFF